MGFLDGLCDTDDHVSWSSFWRVENVCSLTVLGSVVPLIYAACTMLLLLGVSLCSRSSGATTKQARRMNGGRVPNGQTSDGHAVNGTDEGHEEAKGGDNDAFMDSATEPLLGSDGDGSHLERTHVMNGRENEAGPKLAKVAKKSTAVHWLKLLLYWIQVLYHLCVGGFFLIDGHADHPYQCELGGLSSFPGRREL